MITKRMIKDDVIIASEATIEVWEFMMKEGITHSLLSDAKMHAAKKLGLPNYGSTANCYLCDYKLLEDCRNCPLQIAGSLCVRSDSPFRRAVAAYMDDNLRGFRKNAKLLVESIRVGLSKIMGDM